MIHKRQRIVFWILHTKELTWKSYVLNLITKILKNIIFYSVNDPESCHSKPKKWRTNLSLDVMIHNHYLEIYKKKFCLQTVRYKLGLSTEMKHHCISYCKWHRLSSWLKKLLRMICGKMDEIGCRKRFLAVWFLCTNSKSAFYRHHSRIVQSKMLQWMVQLLCIQVEMLGDSWSWYYFHSGYILWKGGVI